MRSNFLFRARLIVAYRFFAVAVILNLVFSPAQSVFAFGTGEPTVPNPSVFTGQGKTLRVDEPTGAFIERLVLDIPPGRAGLQPDVALEYNSQNTSDGILGYGWSLSTPYIQRLNKTGSENLYDTNSYFTSSIDGELASQNSSSGDSPSFLDSLPLTLYEYQNVTSDSRSYTVPSGGSNKLFLALVANNFCSDTPTMTLNGSSLTVEQISGTSNRACYYVGYIANPSSGTFQISYASQRWGDYVLFTLQDAAQTSPIDDSAVTNEGNQTSNSTSVTTTEVNDLIVSIPKWETANFSSFGAGETEYFPSTNTSMGKTAGSYKAATATSTYTMTINISSARDVDQPVIAVKAAQTAASSYRARVDDGSFNSYTFSDNTWTVYDKKGNRYIFGSSDSGKQYDISTGTTTNTYKWMLEEIRDPNDNFVTYTYLRDENELYPHHITYTGNGTTDGISTITFATSTRPDTRVSYAGGFVATTSKRISRITASVNGTTVRKYDLDYDMGNNGYRSVLTGFSQNGYDENNVIAIMPTTTFAYASSSTQFFSPTVPRVANQSYAVADVNGNGINDIVVFYNKTGGGTEGRIYPDGGGATTTVSTPPQIWADQTAGSDGYTAREVGSRLIDVTGDGKADVMRGVLDDSVFPREYTYTKALNTYATSTATYGWTSTTTYDGSIPEFTMIFSEGSPVITTGVFGDVNGDGLPDFARNVPDYVSSSTLIGNGSAWDNFSGIFSAVKSFPTEAQTEHASQLVDVNGDGLDDWMYSQSSTTLVHLNNGTGWNASASPYWTIATSTLYLFNSMYYDRGIRYMDLNGDGLPDFVRSYQNASTSSCSGPEVADVKIVLLNTGNGWATSSAYTLPAYITFCNGSSLTNNEFVNFNGNGQFTQDVLSTVTNAHGGITQITYAPTASSTNNTNPELPFSLLTVKELVENDGRGNYATTTYSYHGGKLYLESDVRDRKFAGFAFTTATSSNGATVTYFNQGTGVDAYLGEVNDGYGQINKPFRKDIVDLSSNIKQRTFYRWDAISYASTTFVGLGAQTVWDFAGDGTHRDKATEYSYSSTTNDLVRMVEYGEVTGSSNGTFTDTGTEKRTTNISYAASTSANMSVPTQKTVFDYNSATTSDQKLYYDSLAFGLVTAGNNTREENWISGSTYASSTKTYNSYGLVATSTDRLSNATSYVYDPHNLFVATATNPLLQKTHFYYDYSNGKVKQKTDPNNGLTKNVFDGLGRLTEVDVSSTTTPSVYATTTTYVYTDSTTTPSSIKRTNWLTAASTVDSYQYFDGFDRLIQDRKMSPTADTYAVSDRIYNSAGLLASSSLPYFSSGTALTSPTAISALYTDYYYDPLQRITETTNAVGSTAHTYTKWTTTATDPNENVKEYVTDAFGNLVNVVEHSTSTATTTYSYDTQNNLATTTDAFGNVRRFTYDGLGRRLTAEDLHASADGTYGTWTYTYDHQGNITSQTDPKGQVVNRTYDALNRMLTEDYTGDAGTEITLSYDSCTNGIGYLCAASSTSALTANKYDILGRVQFGTTTVLGIPYGMSYSYDRQGNVASLTYPNSTQVSVEYNIAGLPSRIQRKPLGDSFSDIVSSFTYAPTGQGISTIFGNGASSTRTYNQNALYRLSGLQTLADGSYAQDVTYEYDAVGNITELANAANASSSATTVFTYDALNRLLSAATIEATSTPYTQSFTYDALGNMLTLTSDTSTSTLDAAPSIMDSLPLTLYEFQNVTSESRTYTVPSGGSNKVLFALIAKNACNDPAPTATQNGDSLTVSVISGTYSRACYYIGYRAAPTSGTFQMNFSGATWGDYVLFTLENAAQSSPIDDAAVTNEGNQTSNSTSVTTTLANDLIISIPKWETANFSSFGSEEIQYVPSTSNSMGKTAGSYKVATTSGSHTMTITISSARDVDEPVVAIKSTNSPSATSSTLSLYAYAGTDYANPHAPTQIATGVSTTTYTYDNNGNLSQKTTDGIITTYLWDYANRLVALGSGNNGTTTYGYDAFGTRVFQIATTSTTTYANRWYSVASTTKGATLWATTTEYLFNSDTLLATADQQFADGVATSSEEISYIHPDHLGSIAVTTDESGAAKTVKDFYPYGSERISTGPNISKTYIGLFNDAASELLYANARYLDPARGQFLSQDPVFWELGSKLKDQTLGEVLKNPQSFNSYSYAENNPITKKDPEGRCAGPVFFVCLGVIGANVGIWTNYVGDVLDARSRGSTNTFQFNLSYKEIVTSGGLGAFELAALPQSRIAGGIYAYGSSLAEDRAAGNPLNYSKALVSGGTAFITGSLFQGLAGRLTPTLQTRSQISSQVFQNASILVVNNYFGTNNNVPSQTTQSPNGASIQNQIAILSLQVRVLQLQLQIAQLQTSHAQSTPATTR